MNTKTLCKSAGIAVILSITATLAQARNYSAQDFVTRASVANQFEIESSRLALDKAQSDEVKSFAQQMIDDHTQTANTMEEVLQSSSSHAKTADALDSKHRKLLNKLEAASKDGFDSSYLSIQHQAHQEAVDLFSDYAKNGKDVALKDFAKNTLPTLQEHLEHVKELRAR